LRAGRPAEQKKAMLEALMAQANKTFAPAFAARGVALTVELHEIDPEYRLMRNGLRERAQSSAA
jgi:5-carboxymethyl-2-hydroxymuconate isomerase